MTNDEAAARRAGISERSLTVSRVIFGCLLALTFLGVVAIAVVLMTGPPPAEHVRVEMQTQEVVATGDAMAVRGSGMVRMRTWMATDVDPECLIATQWFINLADGQQLEVPGFRWTTPGDLKQTAYESPVPRGAKPGAATYLVRDTYSCGLRVRRVVSPPVPFVILPPAEPAATDSP